MANDQLNYNILYSCTIKYIITCGELFVNYYPTQSAALNLATAIMRSGMHTST